MAKLYFRATLDPEQYRRHEILKHENLFLVTYQQDDKERIQKEMRAIVEKNDRNVENGKEPVELEVSIKIHYRARSLNENALLWAIYTKFAEILNKEARAVKKITAQELYDQDMIEYAKVYVKTVPIEFALAVIEYAENGQGDDFRGHLIDREYIDDETVKLYFRETSSFWNTSDCAAFIDIKLHELEEMKNRTEDGEIKGMIDDFMKLVNKKH